MAGAGLTAIKILGGAAAVYAAVVLALYLAQTWLLFPAWMAGAPGGEALPARGEGVTLTAADGTRLSGVSVPPARPADAGDAPPVVLGFGGNAWTAAALAGMLARMLPACQVVAVDYRGYGASAGRPSAEAFLADSLAVYDEVVSRFGGRRVVAVGLSIGSGVAAHLAAHRPVDGVVLITPFDSLKKLARAHYPWLPAGLLLRHRMPAAATLSGVDTPSAIIAAAEDTIVAPARTAALRKAISHRVFDRTIDGAGHNDLYGHPAFPPALRAAIARVIEAGRK